MMPVAHRLNLEVIKPGLLDLVMDLGRPGYRAQGVPAGGAADVSALVAANRRLGNPDHAAGIEMLQTGPTLRFPMGGRVALAGAEMPVFVDGVAVSFDSEISMAPGAMLQLGRTHAGLRTTLAVAGGLDVPLVMNSRATFLPAGFGGFCGRALRGGDVIPIGSMKTEVSSPAGFLSARKGRLRILPGPQIGGFADTALAALASLAYRISPDSNRIGIRLAGPPLTHRLDELPSQGVLPGAIQVPPDGQPIILGWDGPVTGGYPVIAAIIQADLSALAQCAPGAAIHFEFVSHEQAVAARQKELPWLV